MTRAVAAGLAGLALSLGGARAQAQWWNAPEAPGDLVQVSVDVNSRRTPLYRAPDGSERWYVEAREGASYAVVLANRTPERLGVVLTVDGLNAISGERDSRRMYVLAPWEETVVRGWRTSLDEVRRFTFVDERASYAVRSGKAGGKMGWIEAAVYRERPRRVYGPRIDHGARGEGRPSAEAPLPAAPPTSTRDRDEAPADDAYREAEKSARSAPGAGAVYPGTGWGHRTEDHAVEVRFEPESAPADQVTLRYEYRSSLVALGILPRRWPPRDRLRERERGEQGFAQPPAW